MKRIIKKILKAICTILSRFGFTFGEPSGSHRSTPPPSKVNLDQVTQEYGDEEIAEAIQAKDKNNECLVAQEPTSLPPDSSGTIEKDEAKVLEPDALAQEPYEVHSHSDDAVDEEITEELVEEKFILIKQVNDKPSKAEQPLEDVGSEIESDLTSHQLIKGVTGSTFVESTNNDNLSGASQNSAVDGSTKTTTTLSEKKTEDTGSSKGAGQVCKEDSIAEVESAEENSKRSGQSVSDSISKGVVDGERTPRSRQPAPREDAGEYKVRVRDVSVVDQEYAHWNSVIVDHILLAKPRSEDVYLCVNPRLLAKVFDEAGLAFLSHEQAEQRFSTAVANVYRKRVLEHSDHLHVLRRCSDDGYPDCVAFLAGSVLAAYHMQSDGEVSGNAYYKRLAKLLGCDIHGSGYPVGFNPPVFESLWVYLKNWLHKEHKRRLVMPQGDAKFRRFVALPLAHVPLRSLDIERLPYFFSWAGYQPGGRVRPDQLLFNLRRWQQSKNMLTPTGAGALSDDRVDAVVAQVSAELKSWDGSLVESASRYSALVEIHFDIVQRKPILSYLPHRPSGFPIVFDDGERVFEASDEGWYDPAQIRPVDGELLETGFEWCSHINGTQFVLRRSEALVVPLVPSSTYSGFLSSRRLLHGVKCSILCHNKVTGRVQEYLSEVAQQQLKPITHSSLPNNWSIFRDITARVHVEAPSGLEALAVDPNIELVVAGGLRLGRRWSWLVGAPPQIMVSGMEGINQVKVNGASVEIGMNGELLINDVLTKPGEYLIEAGGMRRRIEIARPQISIQEKAERCESPDGDQNVKIALPSGDWTLIGNSPDQVYYSRGGFFRGTLASCPFYPSWAMQVGAGPGAIIAVFANPSPPQVGGSQSLTRQSQNLIKRWVSVVYASHIRRPHFIGLNGMVMDGGIVDIWKQYVAVAKKIKRKLKRK